jgi:hypothetical protein
MNLDSYSSHSSSAAKLSESDREARQRPLWRRPEVTVLPIQDVVSAALTGSAETCSATHS